MIRQKYRVHAVDDTSAEVTEGSAFFGGCGSALTTTGRNPVTSPSLLHHRMHLPRAASGAITLRRVKTGGRVDFTLHRVGKNLKGRVLATMLRVFGRRIFRQDFQQTLGRLAEATGRAFLKSNCTRWSCNLCTPEMSGGRNRAVSASRSTTTMNSARKQFSK